MTPQKPRDAPPMLAEAESEQVQCVNCFEWVQQTDPHGGGWCIPCWENTTEMDQL